METDTTIRWPLTLDQCKETPCAESAEQFARMFPNGMPRTIEALDALLDRPSGLNDVKWFTYTFWKNDLGVMTKSATRSFIIQRCALVPESALEAMCPEVADGARAFQQGVGEAPAAVVEDELTVWYCEPCRERGDNRIFEDEHAVREHVEGEHSSEATMFICTARGCDYTSTDDDDFNEHMRDTHTEEDEGRHCDTCNEDIRADEWDDHVDGHVEEATGFKCNCPDCDTNLHVR